MNIHDEFTALVIVRAPESVLVVERTDWPTDKNFSFPGGKKEGDESPFDTARRELLEETGLYVEPNDFKILG